MCYIKDYTESLSSARVKYGFIYINVHYINMLKRRDTCLKLTKSILNIFSESTQSNCFQNIYQHIPAKGLCLPFPWIHKVRISKLICSASSWCFVAIVLTSAPVSSFSSRIPKIKYFVLTCFGILISPLLPGKLNSFNKLGLSPANSMKQKHTLNSQNNMPGHSS